MTTPGASGLTYKCLELCLLRWNDFLEGFSDGLQAFQFEVCLDGESTALTLVDASRREDHCLVNVLDDLRAVCLNMVG